MSNPFADSNQQRLDSNPFEDPSIYQAQQSHRQEYTIDVPSEPKQPTQQQPNEMSSRFDDLTRRERELADREAALTARAEHLRVHGRNNWPPGPYPLIYHDIDVEIPEQHKSSVLTLYRLWMLLVVTLIANLVAAILLLISGGGASELGSAILYLPVIGVLSFLTWYRPAYNAYMKESSVFFYIFFVFGLFHLLFCTYILVGIPGTGSAGLINLIRSFTGGHLVAGIFCVIATVGWTLETAGFLWMYKNVYSHSHGEAGHTLAQAKEELAMYGFKAYVFGGNKVPAK